MAWTRISDPEQAVRALLIWFVTRMIGLRGRFGLLLTSGDILRIITALHESPNGVIMLDVLLDHAGVPDGVDQAWRTKHYLGAPVPGATMATVNLAHVVTAVEFVVAEIVEQIDKKTLLQRDELEPATELPVPENLERPTPELLPDTSQYTVTHKPASSWEDAVPAVDYTSEGAADSSQARDNIRAVRNKNSKAAAGNIPAVDKTLAALRNSGKPKLTKTRA